ncbi:ATP12 family chaperone protein [Pseudaestuariivita rosea]|uniref:ATP12 family chaperone protein n=1 Tax=Pseudaestuariivita rosea TaxID=2763263 RepID=UPI001ABA6C25
MSEWKQKRFWTSADVVADGAGFTVVLDGRHLKTPAKRPLVVPTEALAKAIADEWQRQNDLVDPLSMPFTRSANAAIDKVASQKSEVADLIAAYAETDLLCYRAAEPVGLIDRQMNGWDPLLDWAAETYGARLQPVSGVMYHTQPPDAIRVLSDKVHSFDDFALTAVHDLVSLTGSVVIGLAATHDHFDPSALWQLSRIDEDWQIEQWGVDEEAAETAQNKRNAFLHAHRFYNLTQN